MSRREEWESMEEKAQFRMICGCISKAAKRRGMSVNAADYAGEVWLRLADRLDGAEEDLLLLVYRAADNALQQAAYQDRKFAAADNTPVMGADGDELGGVLDLIADGGNVEAVAILRADFGRFFDGLDEINKKIVNGRAAGLYFREIAPTLPKEMTLQAIMKRLGVMEKAAGAFLG